MPARAASSSSMSRIAPLSEPTAAAMRAHLAFPTLSVLALALIHNALDAGAQHIQLSLDFDNWSLTCSDDGRGFPLDVFPGSSSSSSRQQTEEGILAPSSEGVRRQSPRSLPGYGRSGKALQSMAHLGRLTINTAPEGAPGKAFVLIQRLPVRRRVLDAISKKRAEVERVKKAITIASLREPHAGFVLRVRADNGLEENGDVSASTFKEVLRVKKTTSLRSRFLDAYPYLPLQNENVVEVHADSSDGREMTVRGIIGLVPIPTRDAQHIFIDRHLLAPGTSLAESVVEQTHHSGLNEGSQGQSSPLASSSKAAVRSRFSDADVVLHDAVDAAFQASMAFRPTTAAARGGTGLERSARKSPVKGRSGHPAFMLDVTVDSGTRGGRAAVTETGSKRPSVRKLVQEAVTQGLRKRGLLLTAVPPLASTTTLSDAGATFTAPAASSLLAGTTTSPSARRHLSSSPNKRRRTDTPPAPVADPPEVAVSEQNPSTIEHTHEITGRKYLIDARTGNSYELSGNAKENQQLEAAARGATAAQEPISRYPRLQVGSANAEEPPQWLYDSVKAWTNPVLPLPAEPDIPSLSAGIPLDQTQLLSRATVGRREASFALPAIQANSRFFAKEGCGACSSHAPVAGAVTVAAEEDEDELRLQEVEGTVSKDALCNAQVLGQIDRKFVLCAVETSPVEGASPAKGRTLLVVDQHAADERVRVERLLDDFQRCCRTGQPEAFKLSNPIDTDLSEGELVAFKANTTGQRALRRAGFDFSITDGLDSNGEEAVDDEGIKESAPSRQRVLVVWVPSVIKDRLIAERTLVTALLRTFAVMSSEKDALALLSHLVFNDILTQEQCERLISELSGTAFPFQCAHGRSHDIKTEVTNGGSAAEIASARSGAAAQHRDNTGAGSDVRRWYELPQVEPVLLRVSLILSPDRSAGPPLTDLCFISLFRRFGQCGSGAQQCAGGCQPEWSFQASSCQPNPICKNLNVTFKPSDYNNQDMFMPILAYDGMGSGNGGPPFTLDAGNLGKGPEGVLLQMTIGSQAKISTTDYFLYGSVQATLRHNARQGLVAAFILMSDIKDEVDWEFTTSDGSKGFTNYFNLGQYVAGHGTDVAMPNNGDVSNWHTFGINWTPNQLQWTIDGTVVRTLTKSQAGNQFPRSPSRIQLSTWAGGNVTSPQGTQEWAGGLIDWNSPEYKSNGYYSQEIKSYVISCANPSNSGVPVASKRASNSNSGSGGGSGNSYTSWVYTGVNSSTTGEPGYQLSTAPITALKNPSADGSPSAPGADGLSKTSIANSWNGSGVKAKSGGGGGNGKIFSSSAALKYGVPIAAGVIGLILIWAACVWLMRRKRMSTVGKNNPLGAPGTAITGSAGMAHNLPAGGGVTGALAGKVGKRTSQYAPLGGTDYDDAPMGAQKLGSGYGPAVGPRPGPMPGIGANGGAAPSYPPASGGNHYEMGSPYSGYPPQQQQQTFRPAPAAPYSANPSGYFPSPAAQSGMSYGAPQGHHGQYSSGGGYGSSYSQPAYRDY
ncbi:putative glycosidase CRH2 [Tilletia horrida]|uniref:Glycosidase CRH2 n=1 Tax=Tilletia horrida TaxID=155126 RepID=A0AAN6GDL0_9BASI|nr:putative glycosidase CRH2 [Tilletia horrida]